ncbi:hypothetical protein [Treponema saccharophilum]|uniref:hypothetical protein n=1 Tax=Treponema saccharophilum TaxID=165 RepID=UPI0030C68612
MQRQPHSLRDLFSCWLERLFDRRGTAFRGSVVGFCAWMEFWGGCFFVCGFFWVMQLHSLRDLFSCGLERLWSAEDAVHPRLRGGDFARGWNFGEVVFFVCGFFW